jgi:hypothetical protein
MKAAFLHKSQLMCFPRNLLTYLRTNGVILKGLAGRFVMYIRVYIHMLCKGAGACSNLAGADKDTPKPSVDTAFLSFY